MMQPLPAFVLWMCCGSGLLIIAAAIPLWLKRVPPNAVYGARFAATLADPRVWYAVNAAAGRSLVVIGALYATSVGGIAVMPAWNHAASLLLASGVLVVALICNTVHLSALGNRLRSARNV